MSTWASCRSAVNSRICLQWHCCSHFFVLSTQVNRPLSMKKDGIQTRNRKVSSKNKNKNKNIKQEQKGSDEHKSYGFGGCNPSPTSSQGGLPFSSNMIISPSVHTPTAFTRPTIPGIAGLHPGLYGPIVPSPVSASSGGLLSSPPSLSVNASWSSRRSFWNFFEACCELHPRTLTTHKRDANLRKELLFESAAIAAIHSAYRRSSQC